MGTGYTAVDIFKRWEDEDQKKIDSLNSSKIELEKEKKKIEVINQKINDLESDVKTFQDSVDAILVANTMPKKYEKVVEEAEVEVVKE